MSKPSSLDRLREISKQKSIRRPILVPVANDHTGDGGCGFGTKVEWPVPI